MSWLGNILGMSYQSPDLLGAGTAAIDTKADAARRAMLQHQFALANQNGGALGGAIGRRDAMQNAALGDQRIASSAMEQQRQEHHNREVLIPTRICTPGLNHFELWERRCPTMHGNPHSSFHRHRCHRERHWTRSSLFAPH